MARDGSGTYTRVSNSFSNPVTQTTIAPGDAETFFDELEDEITDSLSRSGKGGMSAGLVIDDNTAGALVVGANGATNPVLQVDASTASQAAGLKIIGLATGNGTSLSVIDSGSNSPLFLDAKGSGGVTIAPNSTGAITLTRATTLSAALTYGGVALSNAVTGTGNMVLSASPTFTGVPISTTAAVDTNTTQIATTAYVVAQAGAATPLGTAATAVVGTSTRYARADHVHPGREVLTAARTYYVRTDGSDSNTGLADSAGGAFLTIQKAIDTVNSIDMSIYQVTVQVRAGTFTGANTFGNWVGNLPPIILGDTTTPTNVIVHPTSADCFKSDGSHAWHVRGFQLDSTTGGTQIRVTNGGAIYFRSCDFAASAGNHIFCDGGGSRVVADGNYSISGAPGGDGVHMLIADGASGNSEGRTVTVTNTPAWGGAYASVARNGSYRANSMSFVGSATGNRRAVGSGGVIYTAGAGDSYFPGNATGTGTNTATSPYGNYL